MPRLRQAQAAGPPAINRIPAAPPGLTGALAFWLVDAGEIEVEDRDQVAAAWEAVKPLAVELAEALVERKRLQGALAQLRAHDPHAAQRLDDLSKRAQVAVGTANRVLTRVIDRGLEVRHGLFLRGFDGELLESFLALGGKVPAGVRVCPDCALVFTPRRRDSKKCDFCRKANQRRPHFAYEGLADGGYAFHSPLGTRRMHVCEECGERYNPSRSRARFCPSCKEVRRGGRPIPWVIKAQPPWGEPPGAEDPEPYYAGLDPNALLDDYDLDLDLDVAEDPLILPEYVVRADVYPDGGEPRVPRERLPVIGQKSGSSAQTPLDRP